MKKKNKWKKLLAGFMIIVLTFVMMPMSQVKAAGVPSVIDAGTFIGDEFVINSSNATDPSGKVTCSSVTIPAGCKLKISDGKTLEVTGILKIEAGGELVLERTWGPDTFSKFTAGVVDAADGARLFATNVANIPDGLNLYHPDGSTFELGDWGEWGQTFIFNATATRWEEELPPPSVQMDFIDFNITKVEYSWDNTNYIELDLNDGPHDDINTHYDCNNQFVEMTIPDSAMVGSAGEKKATIYLKITSPDELTKPGNVADGDFTKAGDLYTLHAVVFDENSFVDNMLDFHEPAPPHVSIMIDGAFNTSDSHCAIEKLEYKRSGDADYSQIYQVYPSYEGGPIIDDEWFIERTGDSLHADIYFNESHTSVSFRVTLESGKVINHAFKYNDPEHPSDEFTGPAVNIYEYEFSSADLMDWDDESRKINLTTIYENQGMGELVRPAVLDKFIYGYSTTDGTDDALKAKLADEFWSRCKFGDDGNSYNIDDTFGLARVSDLQSKITITAGGTVTATLTDGSTQSIDYKNFSIQFGVDQDGKAVTYSNKVFIIPNIGSTDPYIMIGLVNGGTTTYLLKTYSEQVPFGKVDSESEGDRDKTCGAVLVYGNFEKVLVGGDACAIDEDLNDAAGVFTTQCMWSRMFTRDNSVGRPTAHLRVLDARDTYTIISGGVKDAAGNIIAAYECPAFDANNYDNVAETGVGREKTVFAGYDYLTINPLDASTGATTGTITSITTVPSCQDGVVITAPEAGKVEWTVEFLSAYYCTVPLTITYENGIVAPLTINRTGLVIYADWVGDNPDFKPFIGHETFPGQTALPYNPESAPNSDPNLSVSTVLVYAVYFHPQTNKTADGDDNLKLLVTYDNVNQFGNKYHIDDKGDNSSLNGNQQVVKQTYYSGNWAQSGANYVPFTTFAIGTYNATDYPVDASGVIQPVNSLEVYMPSFSALVVANSYDDPDAFGGTQIGTGKGVHYDGHAVWVAK
ncbi:MAG: hypothetical protein MJ105_09810 [Lachnospiraceae bacterium]|nr:hypothetical protein [Lachnospiraceae bacterium]